MTCQERGRCGEFHAKLSLQRVRRRTVTEYLRLGFPEGHTNLADCLHAASGGISQGGRGVDQSMGGVADGKELHVESLAKPPPQGPEARPPPESDTAASQNCHRKPRGSSKHSATRGLPRARNQAAKHPPLPP